MADEPGGDGEERPGAMPKALRPTVIGGPRAPAPGPARGARSLGPTVMASPERRGPPAPRRPAREPAVTPHPTAIPGIAPTRLSASAEDLRRLVPAARPRVVEGALRAIGMAATGASAERQAALWGHEAQQAHAALVTRAVELSQAPVLARAAGYLNRMTELLAAIDLEAACGTAPDSLLGASALGRILKRSNGRIDTPGELAAARAEIGQLVDLMGSALGELLALRQALEQQGVEARACLEAVEAAALSAEWLSAHHRSTREALSRRYLERSMSLTRSLAQMQGDAAVADVQAEQPLRIVAAIQDVVLVALPGLLGSLAALNGARAAPPTPTEVGEAAFRLRDVLQRLRT